MRCFCENKQTFNLKVEGDVDTDPIWCNQCGCNFDIEEVPLSEDLKDDLMRWAMMYGRWIDWSKDTLLPNGIELENEHNKQGQQLTEKVKKELGTKYRVRFSPSTSARLYSGLDL
jgi:transcription elongation factor Elf1